MGSLIFPPYLQEGDRVIVLSPSSKIDKSFLKGAYKRLKSWGLEVVFAKHAGSSNGTYAGNIRQRLEDLQEAMDDEEAMVRRVGKGSVEEVTKMSAREFYTAYHNGLQERYKVDEEVLKVIRESLSIKLLSLAQEGDRTVHILVRTKHSNGKVFIENLELISLLKNGEKWQVALNEMAPKVTPLDGKTPVRPSADPVKPAGKPTADPVKPAKPVKPKTK